MTPDSTIIAAERADFISAQGLLMPFEDRRVTERSWITPQNINYIQATSEERANVTMLVQTNTVTKFGIMLSVSSERGLVYTGFQMAGSWDRAMTSLRQLFPNADVLTSDAGSASIKNHLNNNTKIDLHVFGTPFQHSVWQTLLQIPSGGVTTYGDIATRIGDSNASRAVGTAVGSNPVSLIIPCHRVIHSDGENKNYGWGIARKALMLALEQAPYSTIKELEAAVA